MQDNFESENLIHEAITLGFIVGDLSFKNQMLYVKFSKAREVNTEQNEIELLQKRLKEMYCLSQKFFMNKNIELESRRKLRIL